MTQALSVRRGRRLTIFLPSLEGGGAERMMVTLANEMAARGIEVCLALARARGPYVSKVDRAVAIEDLQHDSVPFAIPKLIQHLHRRRPDALLAAMSHANVAAAIAWRLAGKPCRLVLSERAHFSAVAADLRRSTAWATKCLMRMTYPWADQITAVSHGVADDVAQLLDLSADQINVVYNPVVDPQLYRLADIRPSHRWLQNKATPVILAAGRMVTQKGFDTLIQAFAQLRAERNVRLVILGDGPLRGSLLTLADTLGVLDDIDLPGFAENPFSEMRAADLFVLSSRYEGLPGVLIQAMACGTPVVSTDCPSGPAEILESGKWGRLVPTGDAAALADAMRQALDEPQSPDVRQRSQAFSQEVIVARYAAALGL